MLFCGGLGLRMRDYSENLPKPLVTVGGRPILWHIMKYYAYWGHRDFILCLGHRGDAIKEYFLNYNEALTNDFVLERGERRLDLLQTDLSTWTITFVETGVESSIGERLRRVAPYLEGEDLFLANYSDGVSDLPLPKMLSQFRRSGAIASFVSVLPNLSYHFVASSGRNGIVTGLEDVARRDLRVNGGFFAFRSEIFNYLRPGEDLVGEPFERLMGEQALHAYRYDGFWVAMDTFKDRQRLEELVNRGNPPWAIWNGRRS
ncbi:MAG: hypothetical protein R2882_10025 [Gemmatimonadales bacterium]